MSPEIKRFKFNVLVGCIIQLCLINLYAYEIRTAGCVISGAAKDSIIIGYLVGDIRSSTQRFENIFGEKLNSTPVSIVIPESAEEYEKLTNNSLPEWSQGVALTVERRIILRPADYFIPDRFREILLHELAHIYLAQIVHPGRVPLWFNEGVAMYMSDKIISWGDGAALGNAIISNSLIDFQEIDSLINFGEAKAQLAYLQSFLAIRYLTESHGPQIIQAILRSLTRGESFYNVFTEKAGYDFTDFEYDFFQRVIRDYKWMSLLQFGNLFWILMVLLVISVFIAIKLRNRKRIKIWDSLEEQ